MFRCWGLHLRGLALPINKTGALQRVPAPTPSHVCCGPGVEEWLL